MGQRLRNTQKSIPSLSNPPWGEPLVFGWWAQKKQELQTVNKRTCLDAKNWMVTIGESRHYAPPPPLRGHL